MNFFGGAEVGIALLQGWIWNLRLFGCMAVCVAGLFHGWMDGRMA